MRTHAFPKMVVMLSLITTACTGGGDSQSGSQVRYSSYPANPANVRLSLTDAPLDGAKAVYVNVSHFEFFIRKGDERHRVQAGDGIGAVDLLQLRNGVLLPIDDLKLPDGTMIEKVRIVLNPTDNHVIRADDSRCDMQTPSAQKSGVKIILKSPIEVASGYTYSLVVDFDAEKSVVLKGNGGCLLKPVIKLAAASRKPVDDGSGEEPGGENSDDNGGEEPVTDGEDENEGDWEYDDEGLPIIRDEDLN